MTDQPFYAPGMSQTLRVPKPGELRWSLRQGVHAITCELRGQGEYGWETQILRDGELWIGRRFDTRALAIQFADVERAALSHGA